VVTSVSITTPGSYSVAPSNPVSVTGGGGSGVLLTGTYSGPGGTNHLIPPLSGTLIGVAVACGGSGYSPGDVLTFVGGTGVAATVTVLTVGKLPDEATLARYVTVEVSPGMEYLTLPQGGFTFVATNHPPVPGTAGKLTPNYDLSLTWEQIPVAAIGTVLYNPSLQNPAIDNCLGCCNSAPFPPAPAATTFQLMTAFPAAGGTSYKLGDVLTLVGGAATIAAQVTVTALATGGTTTGPVLAVKITKRGLYSVFPGNPVTTLGGSGTGCTLTCENGNNLPPGTLLMTAASITPFQSTSGVRLYRLMYRFKFLPQGVQYLYWQGTPTRVTGTTFTITGVTNAVNPTITCSSSFTLAIGTPVYISGTVFGVNDQGVNGLFTVQSVSGSTFTINLPVKPGTYASGGTVGTSAAYQDGGYFEVTTNGLTNIGSGLYNSNPQATPLNIYPWADFATLFRVST